MQGVDDIQESTKKEHDKTEDILKKYNVSIGQLEEIKKSL